VSDRTHDRAHTAENLAVQRQSLAAKMVGRERELDLVLAAVSAGRDLLLEGPPGTSKSTILTAITDTWAIPLLFVEGNAELTPAKLIGHHNPARVLREDYSADNFVPGPLVAAMQRGGFLYIEELNRAPEDTLNALLTAMAERRVDVPRVGRISALPSFRIVASMNPFDNVGTMRISASFYDRLCRLAVGYQSAQEDEQIVALRTGSADAHLIADAVALTRATRDHLDVRQGSSVRGAIDLVAVAGSLAAIRRTGEVVGADLVLDAAQVALSARITMDETSNRTPEEVIRELWEDHFVLRPHRAKGGGEESELPNPI
jgi:MoxR-like ATPase